MTEMLYLSDCYAKEFDAGVISAEGNLVVLDKTFFYPESGGQPADRGEISFEGKSAKVVMVRKDSGSIIHEIDKNASELGISNGAVVHCSIDWERRYAFMRYHTACHVLSSVITKEEPLTEITGNQIGLDKTRVDFSLENFDKEKIRHYEEEANRIISEGHIVTIRFLPREEAFKIPGLVKLRKMLPESLQVIRVVAIEGIDEQACGGTHLKNVSEIRGIEIIGTENKGKSNRRIYFRLKE
ncbi:MAG: alanyl-tRNA editing protein AlaXM [Candidatus Woesearchaeota archaeon]|nr:alanyl-tRNA editing protein AlaXM [Candidatus Woesearchaeota archaeon]